MQQFDYVIIGAGSAGCTLANRLSEIAGATILLLEAGGKDTNPWIHIPIGYLYCIGNPNVDWCFHTEAEPGLNGRTISYPRGRVLGGSSSINGMIYMRGQAANYDQWQQLGCEGWGWDDVLPMFIKSEHYFDGNNDWHGAGGPWRVERARVRWNILDAFQRAAQQAGIPKVEDFNRGNNEGSAYFDVNQKRGIRWNTSKAFLKQALTRKNLELQTHAQVRRLVIENGHVTGVEYERNGSIATVTARREIILSAGAVGSPHILELSGIGRGDVLQQAGIDIVLESRDVGENLQDHLQLRCAFRVSGIKTLNEQASSLIGKGRMALEYLFNQSGPMAMAPSQLGVFTKSDASFATPNLQYHVQPLSLEKFGDPVHPFPAFTASVCNLRPQSRGSIHITSPDFQQQPAIAPNYLAADADKRVAVAAILLTRKIISQPALAAYQPEEFQPGLLYQSEDDLIRASGKIGTTIYHPVGTCRMGIDAHAVVDPQLRLRGLTGLRIADASIMPTIISGNTNSPTIMIAEKAAVMIKESAKK